jgi:hypothetical protein
LRGSGGSKGVDVPEVAGVEDGEGSESREFDVARLERLRLLRLWATASLRG